ncbi:MAG: efflux RND transporter periplasmic adaptor subunit [Bacteroidota bacterium]|nr:efflux RND transporter periplasmic adaptor subunit [Bacteroidota bacterium]
MKRFLIIGGILVTLLIVVIIWKKSSSSEILKVATEKATKRDITEIVSASGKVQPEVEVKISSDVSGEIVELLVKEGDTVRKGDLLLRIDPVIYQSAVQRMSSTLNGAKAQMATSSARLEQSKAQLNNAEASFNRNKKLHDQGAISDSEFEQIKATYEGAVADVNAAMESVKSAEFNVSSTQASLKEANDNLAKTTIYAPVDGTISRLNKRKGERIIGMAQMEGTEIMRLANLNEMEVLVDVNENDILRVLEGDTALIEVDAHNNRKFKGVVTEVANSANTLGLSSDQVTNFPVKIRIIRDSYVDLIDPKHPDRYAFLPGMTATVEIQTKSVLNAIAVPIQSVTTREDTAAKSGVGEKNEMQSSDEDEEDKPVVVTDTKNKEKKEEKKAIECVFVYRDGNVKLVAVKTGVEDNMYIEIISGLKENDEVVSAPYKSISTHLYSGAKVKKVSKEQLSVIEE